MMRPTIALTMEQFLDLPNYSCTLPTGTTTGKRWRRADRYHLQDVDDDWHMGEYGPPYCRGSRKGSVPIFWRPIVIIGLPQRWPRHVRVPLRIIPERPI